MTDANGWRPIETAPRDGAWILAHNGTSYPAQSIFWNAVDGDWEDAHGFGFGGVTHWQPLPGAPDPKVLRNPPAGGTE